MKNRGFTLVETIISFTLAGVVIFVVTTALYTASKAQENASSTIDLNTRQIWFLNTCQDEFQYAKISQVPGSFIDPRNVQDFISYQTPVGFTTLSGVTTISWGYAGVVGDKCVWVWYPEQCLLEQSITIDPTISQSLSIRRIPMTRINEDLNKNGNLYNYYMIGKLEKQIRSATGIVKSKATLTDSFILGDFDGTVGANGYPDPPFALANYDAFNAEHIPAVGTATHVVVYASFAKITSKGTSLTKEKIKIVLANSQS